MLTILMLAVAVKAGAQSGYPKGYFRNPLDIPISLSGNFGELRPNHYHMGIDIKTAQRENLPVHAAADGYISRIKIEPGGFGRAIYINHPNGYSTLYAHLNNFMPKLEAYVKQQQYSQETWKIDLEFPPALFPVKKGDLIAYSGNTGGSQAPHLHFEIRKSDGDVNLNPLLFGMPLQDNVKPRILRFAVYDRTRSVYEQTPKVVPVRPSAGSYTTTLPVVKIGSPLVSFALTAFDTHTGSSNLNGIYSATLFVNDNEEESFTMNNISYNNTRYLNAHIDYRYKTLNNSYLQHLSELPGFLNSIYHNGSGKGVVDISDGNIYDVLVVVKDAQGNTSKLKTRVQFDPRVPLSPPATGKMFYPLMLDGYETPNCEFFIGEDCLYDSVHVTYRNAASPNPDVLSDIHTIGAAYIPLQDSILVRIQPDLSFTESDRPYTVMQWTSGSKSLVQKVQWQQQWASAHFRDFGNFQLIRDTTAPKIIPSFSDWTDLSTATKMSFIVRDNLGMVKNVRAEVDGKWLRFTNDKNRAFIYQFDEKCLSGTHVLTISAEDEAGNKSTVSYNFVR